MSQKFGKAERFFICYMLSFWKILRAADYLQIQSLFEAVCEKLAKTIENMLDLDNKEVKTINIHIKYSSKFLNKL